MFYSHEVLTNRKYGVATVWLVATLGAKSSLKRITRKQMLDVDVEKACRTIVDNAAPMALRLQGNLLYGVSRVYLQQCDYVLADAQSAHSSMVLMLRSVQNYALDPEAGKAKPEQLVLPDDPSFLPDFAFPPPEFLAGTDSYLSTDPPRSGESQSLTPFGSQLSSQSSHVGGYGLVLPSSTPDRPPDDRLEGDHGRQHNETIDIDNLLHLDDPDFAFGEDGDIIEFRPSSHAAVPLATPVAAGRAPMHSDADASARVRQEHREGQRHGDQAAISDPADMSLPAYGEDMPELGATSPFADQQSSEHPEINESTSPVAAPMLHKKRTTKALPKDKRLELRNTELVSWNEDYLKNMESAAQSKIKQHIRQQAKKNADHYVWGSGIGGLGRDSFGARGPLGQFVGDTLFELFTGMSRCPQSITKRDRDNDINEPTQEEGRRKRQRTEQLEEEIGRGGDDEGLFMVGGDEEVELPREAVSALDDQQIFSAMPWNISASKRGSSAIPLSGRVTIMSEQGKQGSRGGSRMVSASPLLRRSTGRPDDFAALQSLDSDAFGGDDFAYAAPTSDAAEVEENLVQPSLRVREALSAEGENFFAFVNEAISEKVERALADLAEMPDEDQFGAVEVEQVTFEELLLPAETSKMVACQGFLMLLSLGTKGMLDIQQPVAFDAITLKLTEKAKAMQITEIGDGGERRSQSNDDGADMPAEGGSDEDRGSDEESSVTLEDDEEELPEVDDRHFEEQMDAGHAVVGNDDDDNDVDDDDRDPLHDSH